jgi:hypothetical protein
MRSWRTVISAVLALVLLGACSDDDPSLSMDRLEDADETCPIDLDAAAEAADLEDEGAAVDVVVERGSGEGSLEAPAIDQFGGVYVECTRPAGDPAGDESDEGAQLVSFLVASDQPRAINLMLPRVQADLELTVDDLQGISDRFAATDEGETVDLGADGPGAAARIAVDGAESAVLYVSATDGAASPTQVRDVLQRLLGEL